MENVQKSNLEKDNLNQTLEKITNEQFLKAVSYNDDKTYPKSPLEISFTLNMKTLNKEDEEEIEIFFNLLDQIKNDN